MKRTYVYIDGEFVEKKRDERGQWHYIQGDIQPYQSMIDGTMITSRLQHRNHLRLHNCIEVGNEDPLKHGAKPPKNNRVEVLKHQVANMTHAQANRILERLRDDIRFTNNPHRSR